MEKLGIENLSKIVKNSAEIGNVASKLLNKAGLLALLGLQQPLAELASVNFPKVVEEVKDLSEEERIVLEALLSETFQPVNPVVDLGLDKFLNLAEKSISIIQKGVETGQEVFETVKDLIGEWKTFLGI